MKFLTESLEEPIGAGAETWRIVWGDGQIFRGPKFLNDVSFGKNFPFHDQNF